jgi:hypothetical protein
MHHTLQAQRFLEQQIQQELYLKIEITRKNYCPFRTGRSHGRTEGRRDHRRKEKYITGQV